MSKNLSNVGFDEDVFSVNNHAGFFIGPMGAEVPDPSAPKNRIRAEHGIPLRRYYSYYNNGAVYNPSLIPIYTIFPNIWWHSRW